MNIESRYFNLVHALVLVGVMTYALADAAPLLGSVGIVIVSCSWLFTTGPGAISSPRWLINVAILVTTALVVLLWVGDRSETVGIFSRYLIWLQFVKLFEPHRPRDQGQLIALSIMTVVGACLTSVEVIIGAMLLVYGPLLLATVVMYQLYACQHRTAEVAHPSERSRIRSGLAGGSRSARMLRDFRRLIAGMFGATMVGMIGFFLLMPRGVGEGMFFQAPAPVGESTASFSEVVQLGQAGSITASREVVAEAKIVSSRTYEMENRRFLLRGAVLDEYDAERGVWSRSSSATNEHRGINTSPSRRVQDDVRPEAEVLTLDVTVLNAESGHLFTTWRPMIGTVEVEGVTHADYHPEHGTLRLNRPSRFQTRSIRYSLQSTEPWLDAAQLEPGWASFDPESLPARSGAAAELRAFALDALEGAGVDPHSEDAALRERIVEAFIRRLQATCTYTTLMEAPLPGEDPVLAFLERGSGHCEYFASALATMCRSVGIPAHVVTGYVTQEYDARQQRHIVRQSGAHAWVQVEVYPDLWKEYDPSPEGALDDLLNETDGLLAGLRRIFGSIEMFWTRAIVTYDQNRQEAALGTRGSGPIGTVFKQLDEAGDRLSYFDAQTQWRMISERVFASLAVGVVAFGLTAGALLLARAPLGRALLRLQMLLAPLRGVFRGSVARERQNAAYGIMLAKLEQAGLGKPAWQPPLAYADRLSEHDADLAGTVRRISELYYAARFGRNESAYVNGAETHELLHRITERLRELRRHRRNRAATA